MAPLISVLIPLHNHTEHLRDVFDSLAKQTYKNIEIIVVDDGSDEPVRIDDFFGETDLKVRCYRQESSGAPAARNLAFSHSRGAYVIFWDADVVGSPQMLEMLFAALQQHPEASYAYSDFLLGTKRMTARPFDAAALRENNYIPTMSLIRREDVVPWDETLKRFQDWDLWLTMLEQGKTGVYVRGFLWRAVPHTGGMSSWLPSFAYRFPFCFVPGIYGKVKAYTQAKRVVQKKHGLL